MTVGDVPVQRILPGMPRRLYACTPTRLTTWLDCPRRYRFAYLDRPQPPRGPAWAHSTVGAAVHVALAAWWSLPLRRDHASPVTRTPAGGADLLRSQWRVDQSARLGFASPSQSADARDRAAGWVESYLQGVDPADEPVGVERVVATPTSTLALSGRVDRLDHRADGLAVVDYKTGRRPPQRPDARASLALAVYALAAARTLRRACTRVELHHLPTGEVVAADHDDASLARKLAELESLGADARAADAAFAAGRPEAFPPAPSSQCSWCDWRRQCPEGMAAAPDIEPWAAI